MATTALDPTVVAIPFYFGSMEVERRWLARRAEQDGPSPADYERRDTIASLSMGVASLFVPLATHALAQKFVPGKGRYGKALVRAVAGAAAATTIADRVVRSPRASRKAKRAATQVARVGGPIAVGGGVLAAATWTTSKTSATRMWTKGQRHDLGNGPLAWLAAIAGWDFIYYWNHRFMHEVRGMWAIHVVHHSSERYNLSTALRQPVADVLGVWVPYGFLSRLGIRPNLVQQARGLNLIYQYWIHTDAIRSIGAGEEVLNTPSHHRVHHGSNARYIDRNHGSILILWDRLFGTFQREEEQVVYGLTKNIESYAPPVIATHEYRDIVRDVAHSDNWKDRLSFVLRGPGWAYERHRANAALRAG
ncbi:MAG: sterol desaturase family protein [Actinomycetota bacterium]|nr:sterol desaturase family protein [Actinomycetota bacterium]